MADSDASMSQESAKSFGISIGTVARVSADDSMISSGGGETFMIPSRERVTQAPQSFTHQPIECVGRGKYSAIFALKTAGGLVKAAKAMHTSQSEKLQKEKMILDRAVEASPEPIKNVVLPYELFDSVPKSTHELFEHFKVCTSKAPCIECSHPEESPSDKEKVFMCSKAHCDCHKTPEELAVFVQDFGLSLPNFMCLTKTRSDLVSDWQEFTHFIVDGVIDGLEELRRLRIVHRDCKLDNVVIGSDFATKLIDFDCARDMAAERIECTVPNEVFGTAPYTAPEVWECWLAIRNDEFCFTQFTADDFFYSDLYSVGLMALQLMAGDFKKQLRSIVRQELNTIGDIAKKQTELRQYVHEHPDFKLDFKEFVLCLLSDTPTVRANCKTTKWWASKPESSLQKYKEILQKIEKKDKCLEIFLNSCAGASGSGVDSVSEIVAKSATAAPTFRTRGVAARGTTAAASAEATQLQKVFLDGSTCTELYFSGDSMVNTQRRVLSQVFGMNFEMFEVNKEKSEMSLKLFSATTQDSLWTLCVASSKNPLACEAVRKVGGNIETLYMNFEDNTFLLRVVTPMIVRSKRAGAPSLPDQLVVCIRISFVMSAKLVVAKVSHIQGDFIESQIFAEDFEQAFKVHTGVSCSACGKDPIVGPLWICASCPTRCAVCHECHEKSAFVGQHDPSHHWFMMQFALDSWAKVTYPISPAFPTAPVSGPLAHTGYFCDGAACHAKRDPKSKDTNHKIEGTRYIVALGTDFCRSCFVASKRINHAMQLNSFVPAASNRSSYAAWARSVQKLTSNVSYAAAK